MTCSDSLSRIPEISFTYVLLTFDARVMSGDSWLFVFYRFIAPRASSRQIKDANHCVHPPWRPHDEKRHSLIYGGCDFSSWQYNPARTRHPWRIQARSYREYDGMKANRQSRVIFKWTLNPGNGQSTSTELRSNRPPPRPSVTRFSFFISFFWASSASSASLAPVAAFLPQWTPIILFFSSFVSLL